MTTTLYDKGIEATIEAITTRRCVYCHIRLDEDLGRKDWHIPMCIEHRKEFLEKMGDKVLYGDINGAEVEN